MENAVLLCSLELFISCHIHLDKVDSKSYVSLVSQMRILRILENTAFIEAHTLPMAIVPFNNPFLINSFF